MKRIRFLLLAAALLPAMLGALPAQADGCYADYKAKQTGNGGDRLRLRYGVIQIHGACARPQIDGEVANRLSAHGWPLLDILSVFGSDGLAQRQVNARDFFLNF